MWCYTVCVNILCFWNEKFYFYYASLHFIVPDFYTDPFILTEMQVFNSRIGSGTPLLQTAAHLSPGCLCEGLGHPLQLLQHNPQVLLMICHIQSLWIARVRCQWEQKLKDGLQFLLHLGGTGQKMGVRVYPDSCNTMGIAQRIFQCTEPKNANEKGETRPACSLACLGLGWYSNNHSINILKGVAPLKVSFFVQG